jgi:hypothetical protein
MHLISPSEVGGAFGHRFECLFKILSLIIFSVLYRSARLLPNPLSFLWPKNGSIERNKNWPPGFKAKRIRDEKFNQYSKFPSGTDIC